MPRPSIDSMKNAVSEIVSSDGRGLDSQAGIHAKLVELRNIAQGNSTLAARAEVKTDQVTDDPPYQITTNINSSSAYHTSQQALAASNPVYRDMPLDYESGHSGYPDRDPNFQQATQKLLTVTRCMSYLAAAYLLVDQRVSDTTKAQALKQQLTNQFVQTIAEIDQLTKTDGLKPKHILGQMVANFGTTLVAADIKRTETANPKDIAKAAKAVRVDLITAEKLINFDIPRPTMVTEYTRAIPGSTDHKIHRISDRPITVITDKLAEEYRSIFDDSPPLWFNKLSDVEQKYLKNKFSDGGERKDLAGIKATMTTIPCNLRGIPGLANFSEHKHEIFNSKGELISEQAEIRYSIIKPIDIKPKEKLKDRILNHLRGREVEDRSGIKAEAQRITNLNFEQAMEANLQAAAERYVARWGMPADGKLDLPVLAQTLVSPTKFFGRPNSDAKWVAAKNEAIAAYQHTHPNGVTFTLGGTQITVTAHIASTNRPINAARNISRLFVGKQQRQADKLADSCSNVAHHLSQKEGISDELKMSLETLKGALQSATPRSAKLTAAIAKLKEALNKDKPELDTKQARALQIMANALADYSQLLESPGQAEGRSLELFQAALEQIITSQAGGFGMSSCKSTKDRNGSVTMQVDAMMEFYDRHGRLPNYHDNKADRAEFCKIFADIYHSGHNLAQAGLNSNGCDGVKSKQPIDKIRVRNPIAKAGVALVIGAGVALAVGLTVFSGGLLPLAAIAIGLVTAGLMTKMMTPPTLLPDDIQQAIGQKAADARADIADLNKISKDPVIEQIKEQVSAEQAQYEQAQTAELDTGSSPTLPTGLKPEEVRASIEVDPPTVDPPTSDNQTTRTPTSNGSP